MRFSVGTLVKGNDVYQSMQGVPESYLAILGMESTYFLVLKVRRL